MEAPLFRVPLEEANRYFRLRQKAVERTLGSVTSTVEQLPTSASAAATQIEATIRALEELRESCSALGEQEQRCLGRLAARNAAVLQRSVDAPDPLTDPSIAAIEHLYRRGHIAAADALLPALPPHLRAFFDVDASVELHACASALLRHDLSPALRWTHDNASRLRRTGSCLDFALRRQQFVEMIRSRDMSGALEHATLHLAPAATAAAAEGGRGAECVRSLQAVMSLLAFPDPPRCGIPDLEKFFAPVAWTALAGVFLNDAEEALGYPRSTRLEVACAAGITALRTPSCVLDATSGSRSTWAACDGLPTLHSDETPRPSGAVSSVSLTCSTLTTATATATAETALRTVALPPSNGHSCPVCHPLYFAEAAAHVPTCRRGVSSLLCSVTREPMNDGNPPCVLPNGRVFAARTLELLMTDSGEHAQVIDPTSGAVFPQSAIRKAFVL